MTTGHKFTTFIAIAFGCFLICAGYGWLQEREARIVVGVQQANDKAAVKELQDSITERQRSLEQTLQSLAAMKQTNQTPAQIVQALPQVLALPVPVTQVTEAQAKAAAALPDAPQVHVGDLIVPAASVKPLYDAQVECKANVLKLDACTATAVDEQKIVAVKDEQIEQLNTALKGGTKWHRFKGVLKAVGVGALIGAGAVAYVTHK